MKTVKYNFSESDIKTCLFALSMSHLLEDDSVPEAQIMINNQLAHTASDKLSKKESLTPNELRVLCCCILACQAVCQNDLPASKDDRDKCVLFVLQLNKLCNELCSQIL